MGWWVGQWANAVSAVFAIVRHGKKYWKHFLAENKTWFKAKIWLILRAFVAKEFEMRNEVDI